MLSFKETREVTFTVSVVITPDEGGFHAYAPALKGLHVDGRTEDEAFERAKEAVGVYLKSLIAHGDPVPIGSDLTVHEEVTRDVTRESHFRNVTLQWPSLSMSGIS